MDGFPDAAADCLFTLCYPTLFPGGVADPTRKKRKVKVTLAEGVKHLIKWACREPRKKSVGGVCLYWDQDQKRWRCRRGARTLALPPEPAPVPGAPPVRVPCYRERRTDRDKSGSSVPALCFDMLQRQRVLGSAKAFIRDNKDTANLGAGLWSYAHERGSKRKPCATKKALLEKAGDKDWLSKQCRR